MQRPAPATATSSSRTATPGLAWRLPGSRGLSASSAALVLVRAGAVAAASTLSQYRCRDQRPVRRAEWGNCDQTRFSAGGSRHDRSSGGTTVLLMAGLARFAEWRFKTVNMIGNCGMAALIALSAAIPRSCATSAQRVRLGQQAFPARSGAARGDNLRMSAPGRSRTDTGDPFRGPASSLGLRGLGNNTPERLSDSRAAELIQIVSPGGDIFFHLDAECKA